MHENVIFCAAKLQTLYCTYKKQQHCKMNPYNNFLCSFLDGHQNNF